MRRQIHLIMPFMRHDNKNILIEAYRPMDIIWHPIIFQNETVDFNEPWIFPVIIPMNSNEYKALMPGNFKRNWFIKNYEIVDGDYYVTVDDDDMYEAGVFDKIKLMDDDIVIISMKRGDFIPVGVSEIRKYPTTTLYAHPDNVQIGEISAQQSFVKGKIFKQHLFNEEYHPWDGEMAMHHKESGEQIRYEPDLFALFNYYEPGRWDRGNHKIAFGCEDNMRISFGVMVSDLMRLDMVFRQSELDPAIPCHTIKLPDTACKGLNKLLGIMEDEGNDIAILSHQDMFYRYGWIEQIKEKLSELPEDWIVAGPIGKGMDGKICGRIHDMRIPLHFSTSHKFPCPASCFDECCILVNLKKGFRFDEAMSGFDLYGTLCVLQAKEMGGSAWIIDAFCEHYCMRSFQWTPDSEFEKSFKWLHERFPYAKHIDTTVIGIDERENKGGCLKETV